MSTRSIRSRQAQSNRARSSSASVQDIYGGVNIGYMPVGGFAADVVGDDVLYEANRYSANDNVAKRGRASVPTSAIGSDGSQPAWIQGNIARSKDGCGIDLLDPIVSTADGESADLVILDSDDATMRVSRMEGPFVDRSANHPMKGRKPCHFLKRNGH